MEPSWSDNGDYYDSGEDTPSWSDLQDRDKKLETIEDFFKGVLNEIYGTDQLDSDRLEWYLDEIAYQLDVPLPKGRPMIYRPELASNGGFH